MNHIDRAFGVGGLLATTPGYCERPGQIAMARAVDRAIVNRKHLLVEGSTGVGKGLAYLVPAIHHAVENGSHVCVVTANIALQEQLIKKDLPQLASVLPESFTFALLKGRNNYLCLSRLDDLMRTGPDLVDDPADAEAHEQVFSWAQKTVTGDVSELDVVPPPRVWARFSRMSDECKGQECSHDNDCLANAARAKATDAHVVVTNYHLLCADVAIRMENGHAHVVPEHDILICDELHRLGGIDGIAADFFGFKIHAGMISWVAQQIRHHDPKLCERVKSEADRLFMTVRELKASKAYVARFRQPPDLPIDQVLGALRQLEDAYRDLVRTAKDADERAGHKKRAERCATLAAQLREVNRLAREDCVYYIETMARDRVALAMTPIDVSPYLRDGLFSDTDEKVVIGTSATIAVGGTFEHVATEIGCDKYDELIAASPFDFKRQCRLIIPSDLPDPRDPKYPEVVAKKVKQAIDLAGGRTLGLFTSYRNLNRAYEVCQGNGHRVLRQGDMPRTALIDEFRRDVQSSLLGTASFWEGIDVVGEALSLVVIDRIPFATPDDPVMDALTERDPGGWFFKYAIPAAAIKFKQGFGRLIRSTSDRGVVLCLDNRLLTKNYGRLFIRSLPPVEVSTDMEEIGRFLAK